jgi:RNA polymerase sigma-70 factor (ECF subfamily)
MGTPAEKGVAVGKAPEQLPAGPPKELEALIRRMADPLLRLAARIVGNVPEAEDVLQESWSRALRSLRQGGFDQRSSLETWLYRIVTHAALNARRAQRRRAEREVHYAPPTMDAQGALEATLALRDLARCLDELPEAEAAALVLKELQGLTAAQVAQVLECSEGAVEQRLFRARATLRRRFQDG